MICALSLTEFCLFPSTAIKWYFPLLCFLPTTVLSSFVLFVQCCLDKFNIVLPGFLSHLCLYIVVLIYKNLLYFLSLNLYICLLISCSCLVSSDTSPAFIWHLTASLSNFLLSVFYFFICSTIIQAGFTLKFAGFHQSGWHTGSCVSTEMFYLKAIRLKCDLKKIKMKGVKKKDGQSNRRISRQSLLQEKSAGQQL